MQQYRENFKRRGYISDTGNDNIEGLKELDKDKLIQEIGIEKKGMLLQ